MADELDQTIRENAQGPAEARGDAISMRQHSLADQIAADRYLASKTARALHPAKAFSRVRLIPPGA